jgi:anti-sigma B factor antagonist
MEAEKSTCNFEKTAHDNFVVLSFEGRLDMSNHGDLSEIFDAEIKDGHHNIIINLKKVNFISSTCLGIIVSRNKIIEENNGRLIVCGMSREVHEIFDLLNLNKFLNVFIGEPEEAVKHFEN